MHINLIKAN